MRVIIAGTRTATADQVRAVIEACPFASRISAVISGLAPGVDAHGAQWAREAGLHVDEFPADWERYGRSAGPRRNAQMIKAADGLIAVWDGESPGTRDVLRRAQAANLPRCWTTSLDGPIHSIWPK